MKRGAVIVAGGTGSRMGTATKKQYLKLHDKEILLYTIEAFETHPEIHEIIVVVGEEDQQEVTSKIKAAKLEKVHEVTIGGQTRQDSVYNGLKCLSGSVQEVFVHDGARPLIDAATISRVIENLKTNDACIVGVPVKDTIKCVNEEGIIVDTPARETLWSIQTPQGFKKDLLNKAYEHAYSIGLVGTDDSMLVEAYGKAVQVVQGDYRNIKITTPEDLIIAERLLFK